MLAQTNTVPRPYAPLGELADIGGRRLHWQSAGDGGSTVITEAVMGDFSLT